jgi:hypothetical protein
MSVQRALSAEGSEISLVQNRLNIAALALTALVFSGSFTLSLFSSLHHEQQTDFRIEFTHILTALAIGVTTGMASIGCFLHSQQSFQQVITGDDDSETTVQWYRTRQWWFSLGQIFLYMALSQALSASLTEVVYGVSLSRDLLGLILGVLALPVWWLLLFFGPIKFLRRMRPFQVDAERRALYVIYGSVVVGVILLTTTAYGARPSSFGVLRNSCINPSHGMRAGDAEETRHGAYMTQGTSILRSRRLESSRKPTIKRAAMQIVTAGLKWSLDANRRLSNACMSAIA